MIERSGNRRRFGWAEPILLRMIYWCVCESRIRTEGFALYTEDTLYMFVTFKLRSDNHQIS